MIADFLKNLNRKNLLYLLFIIFLISFCVFLDQLTKNWSWLAVSNDQNYNDAIKVTSFLNLLAVYNVGISFGMFQNFQYSNLFFIITTVIIIFFLFFLLLKEEKYKNIACICLIISGAIGNLIDRINYGAVRDFIDFHIMNYHFPVFNLADSMISIGVLIYIFIQVRKDFLNAKIS